MIILTVYQFGITTKFLYHKIILGFILKMVMVAYACNYRLDWATRHLVLRKTKKTKKSWSISFLIHWFSQGHCNRHHKDHVPLCLLNYTPYSFFHVYKWDRLSMDGPFQPQCTSCICYLKEHRKKRSWDGKMFHQSLEGSKGGDVYFSWYFSKDLFLS